jgi:hypothetical protein
VNSRLSYGRISVESFNGMADHVHLLVSLPPTVSVADAVRVIKANSSKWLHQKRHASFAWQNGYGAFSVSSSAAPEVIEYIRRQEEHHRRMTFQEELVAFLKKHKVEYDKRYIWVRFCRPSRAGTRPMPFYPRVSTLGYFLSPLQGWNEADALLSQGLHPVYDVAGSVKRHVEFASRGWLVFFFPKRDASFTSTKARS